MNISINNSYTDKYIYTEKYALIHRHKKIHTKLQEIFNIKESC